MTVTTPTIDEKALEAAMTAVIIDADYGCAVYEEQLSKAIRAYLSALGAEPVAMGGFAVGFSNRFDSRGRHVVETEYTHPSPAISDEAVEPFGWFIRRDPGCEWQFTNYDPERMSNVRGWERRRAFGSRAALEAGKV